MIVVYPWQSPSVNPSSCWNWFDPKDQHRDAGEPSIVAGITRETILECNIDPRLVFVAGMSTGGAMAAVMGATYPDLYAAIGVHSGLAYRSATDVVTAFAAMRGDLPSAARTYPCADEDRRQVRVIVFHGDADRTVHPSNAQEIVEVHERARNDAPQIESGLRGGRAFTRRVIRNPNGLSSIEHWSIRGGGHAWSGGNADGTFADASRPGCIPRDGALLPRKRSDAPADLSKFWLESIAPTFGSPRVPCRPFGRRRLKSSASRHADACIRRTCSPPPPIRFL